MVKVEFRQDKWFEAGKDTEETIPLMHETYLQKQEIKRQLTALSERDLDMLSFQKALDGIQVQNHYEGNPYLKEGNQIWIGMHDLHGECYLGKVIE